MAHDRREWVQAHYANAHEQVRQSNRNARAMMARRRDGKSWAFDNVDSAIDRCKQWIREAKHWRTVAEQSGWCAP